MNFCTEHGCKLFEAELDGATFWYCPRGLERVYPWPELKKLMPAPLVHNLQKATQSQSTPTLRLCPICQHEMRTLACNNGTEKFSVDYCPADETLLFDPGELAKFPLLNAPFSKSFEASREQESSLEISIAPMSLANFARATAKVPQESNLLGAQQFPLVTVAMLALMILCFFAIRPTHELFKFLIFSREIPTHSLLIPWVANIFAHASLLHLATNVYFLYVFGDNVEAALGEKKFIALIVFSAVLANLFFWKFSSGSKWIVGAGGSIAGIMAFYVLTFPNATFTVFRRFRLLSVIKLQMPALAYGAIFLFSPALHLTSTISPRAALLSHAGGALAGFIFWLMTRSKAP